MRCIWSTTASNAINVLSRTGAGIPRSSATFSRLAFRPANVIGPHFGSLTSLRVSATTASFSSSHVIPSDGVSLEEAVDTVSESATSLPNLLPLKPSKISFAAAQGVRMCISNGGIADAFFILNSIRYASHRETATRKMPGMMYSRTEFEAAALQFGPDISPRLSAHALLHGLIRNGLTQPAFDLAKLMMAEGVAIRSKTLEATIQTLVSTRNNTPVPKRMRRLPFSSPNPATRIKLPSDVLMLRPSLMADKGTRFALKLLFLARLHRQRRTDTMFKLLMAASLLNGELVIFSLLFGWACRDWQTMHSLETNLAVITDEEDRKPAGQLKVARARWQQLRRDTIMPDRLALESAALIIQSIFERNDQHGRLVALQALGNLAGLLDRGQIPFPEIEPLIRTMYKCPRVEDEIWIVGEGGCPERIKAYHYFHRVLSSLIQDLPSVPLSGRHPVIPRSAFGQNHRYDMLPPLTLNGYNTLLYYASRYRLSPALAGTILDHMQNTRWEPLLPDTVTGNILLRSWTLLRRSDLVRALLADRVIVLPTPLPLTPKPRRYPPRNQFPRSALRRASETRMGKRRSRRWRRMRREKRMVRLETAASGKGLAAKGDPTPAVYDKPSSTTRMEKRGRTVRLETAASRSGLASKGDPIPAVSDKPSSTTRTGKRVGGVKLETAASRKGLAAKGDPTLTVSDKPLLSTSVTEVAETLNTSPETAVVEGAVTLETKTEAPDSWSLIYRQSPERPNSGFRRVPMSTEPMRAPSLPSTTDVHSLVSYIAYLTESNQESTVTEVLYSVLPELNSSMYRTNSSRPKHLLTGKEALYALYERSVALGPYFFTAVLHALDQSGQDALADRIWNVAKKAERLSWTHSKWTRTPRVVLKPWILGCEPHTVMLHCYGRLARRQADWIPKLPQKRVAYRTSEKSVWAKLHYECQRLPTPLQSDQVQALFRRSMTQAAFDVFNRFIGIPQQHAALPELNEWLAEADIPKPDELFFNAALQAFRPRAKGNPELWHKQQAEEAQYMVKHGVSPPGWNPTLHSVVEHMVQAGFPVPRGLRHLFLGRLPDAAMDRPQPASRYRLIPYTYRPVTKRSPLFRLLTLRDMYEPRNPPQQGTNRQQKEMGSRKASSTLGHVVEL